jgi:hypothetical protein
MTGGGALVGDKFLVVVAGVAEGDAPVGPASFPCAALDAAGHAVNDRGVLELGEHAEHLQHHSSRCGAGVEWLCRGAQGHVELVQLLGDPGELAHLAAQPVDSVDEQLVDAALTGEVERGLQALPIELRAGRAVFVVSDDPPVLLHFAERLQTFLLGRVETKVEMQVEVKVEPTHGSPRHARTIPRAARLSSKGRSRGLVRHREQFGEQRRRLALQRGG